MQMGGILGIVFILGRFEGHHVVNSMVVITLTVAYITCSNAQKSCRVCGLGIAVLVIQSEISHSVLLNYTKFILHKISSTYAVRCLHYRVLGSSEVTDHIYSDHRLLLLYSISELVYL